MSIVIDFGQDEVSESLKSKYGEKITQNQSKVEKSGFRRENGITEYILQESWYKSVKIRITPLNDSKTSIDFKVNYSNRFQEVLVVLTLGVLISTSVMSTFNIYSRSLTFGLLGALYLAPSRFINPLVSEISVYLQKAQSKESQITENSELDLGSKLGSRTELLASSGICFVLGLFELILNGAFTTGLLGLDLPQNFFPLGLKDIGWFFLFLSSFALFRESKKWS